MGQVTTDPARMILEAFRSAVPGREALAQAIRKALIENWKEEFGAKWDEDVLLTGCHKVGGGRGYHKPEEAAKNLALDAADAILSLFTLNPGIAEAIANAIAESVRGEMRHKAQEYEDHWRAMLQERLDWHPRRSHIETAASQFKELAALSQSPGKTDGAAGEGSPQEDANDAS